MFQVLRLFQLIKNKLSDDSANVTSTQMRITRLGEFVIKLVNTSGYIANVQVREACLIARENNSYDFSINRKHSKNFTEILRKMILQVFKLAIWSKQILIY